MRRDESSENTAELLSSSLLRGNLIQGKFITVMRTESALLLAVTSGVLINNTSIIIIINIIFMEKIYDNV